MIYHSLCIYYTEEQICVSQGWRASKGCLEKHKKGVGLLFDGTEKASAVQSSNSTGIFFLCTESLQAKQSTNQSKAIQKWWLLRFPVQFYTFHIPVSYKSYLFPPPYCFIFFQKYD